MIHTKKDLASIHISGLQEIDEEAAQSIVGGAFNFGITRGNDILGSIDVAGSSSTREATQNDSQLRLTANPGDGTRFVIGLAERGGENIATLRTTANPANTGEIIEVGDFLNANAPGRTDIEWRVTQLPPLLMIPINAPMIPINAAADLGSPTSIIDVTGF